MHVSTALANCFRPVLHFSTVVTQEHDIVDISEVRHTAAGSNMNP